MKMAYQSCDPSRSALKTNRASGDVPGSSLRSNSTSRATALGVVVRPRGGPASRSGRSLSREQGAPSDLAAEFGRFHEQSREFSRNVRLRLGDSKLSDPRERAAQNVRVARTMFGKWSLEILSALYGERSVGFEDLRRSLRGITASVLSYRLKHMENQGMVAREVQTVRPVRVRYRLTEKGLTVAVLGEPVFLFLQYTELGERADGRATADRV